MRIPSKLLKLLSILSVIGLLLFTSVPENIQAGSTSVTFTPVADAYVNDSKPDANYGSAPTLRIDESPLDRSYVRFDLSTLSSDPITSAVLNIYANSSLSSGFSVDQLADDTWQESSLTYNNAPAPGSSITHSGEVSSGQWVSIDISSYIQGSGVYDLVFDPLSSTQLSLASRESGSTAPQLIITQIPSATPTPTPTQVQNTPTLVPTSTPSPTPQPTSTATLQPTSTATSHPTSTATTQPSSTATLQPTSTATSQPTSTATSQPTSTATLQPTPTATATSMGGATETFTPVADAYVYSSYPDSNYGSFSSLFVDKSPVIQSYVRFDLSSLSYNVIDNVTLRIYANSSLNAGIDIDQLSDNTWQEDTIDYANAPSPGSSINQSGPISADSWVSIDVTSYINGPGVYSLVLSPISTTRVNLASRESGSHAPQLIITGSSSATPTQPVNTPTPTATQPNTPAPTATQSNPPTPTATQSKTPTPTPTQTTPPTPTSTGVAGQVPNFSHVILMIFENREYSSVVGNGSWPNFNNLASQYALLTKFYAVSHPSLPNYIALTSGSTQGITSDCTNCYVNATNIADIIEGSGRSWMGYMEDMPSACYIGNSGDYVQKHNPFIYYDDIRTDPNRCDNHVVPLTQFDTDLANNQLPSFSWITPNLCNDGHDCSSSTADSFLGAEVSKILASPAFDQNSLLIITFDEGTTSASCCGLPSSAGGHVATILISGQVKAGYQDATPYDHYSILKMLADAWGLPYLEHVGDSGTNSITAVWK